MVFDFIFNNDDVVVRFNPKIKTSPLFNSFFKNDILCMYLVWKALTYNIKQRTNNKIV